MLQTTIITTKSFPRIAYKKQGSGPAVMLIHGFPASGILWDGVVPGLTQYFTVLVPDIPGSGESLPGNEAVSMDALSAIVPAILDDAGFEYCVLAGHSMGGYLALAAAALFPERLKGLSLVHSTAKADDEEKREKRRKSIELIRKGGKEPFIRGMVPGLFSDAFRKIHSEAVGRWIGEGMKLTPEAMIAFYTAMLERPDRQDVVRNAPFPVQWIAGKDDALIPWQSVLSQATRADISAVSLYKECGHMAMVEKNEKLTADLRNFASHCLNSRILEVATT